MSGDCPGEAVHQSLVADDNKKIEPEKNMGRNVWYSRMPDTYSCLRLEEVLILNYSKVEK
jgi:hypothetical protein